MKKLLLLITYNVSLIAFCSAQNPLVKQWDKRFGGTRGDGLTCFQQTIDKGYILGGSSVSDSSGDKTQNHWGPQNYYDCWIVKIDSLGNKQWDKNFGGVGQDGLSCIQQTSDGGYILGGSSSSDSSGDKTQATWGNDDYWIVKIDSLGNKQWDKDLGGTDNDNLRGLQQTADGGYILAGSSVSDTGGDKTQAVWGAWDYWIVKIDSLGNKQWDKDFGGTGNDQLLSVKQTFDGGFIMGGFSSSGISGDKTQDTWGYHDYWIVKIDSLGSKEWDKDFGGTWDDFCFSLQQTSDAGFILGGYSQSGISGDKTQDLWGANGYSDFWIIKTDSLGVKEWDKDFGGIDYEDDFGTISQTDDGGYLIAGTSYSNISGDKTENNLGREQSWILKTDSLGNKQWDKTVFTDCDSIFHDETGLAIQTKDGCYVIANFTSSGIGGYKTQPNWDTIPPASTDFWIIKFCDTTSTTSITQLPDYPNTFSIYPNPAKEWLMVSGLRFQVDKIEIINLLGQTVLSASPSPSGLVRVGLLFPGIYFLKAGNEVRKFVKE